MFLRVAYKIVYCTNIQSHLMCIWNNRNMKSFFEGGFKGSKYVDFAVNILLRNSLFFRLNFTFSFINWSFKIEIWLIKVQSCSYFFLNVIKKLRENLSHFLRENCGPEGVDLQTKKKKNAFCRVIHHSLI